MTRYIAISWKADQTHVPRLEVLAKLSQDSCYKGGVGDGGSAKTKVELLFFPFGFTMGRGGGVLLCG